MLIQNTDCLKFNLEDKGVPFNRESKKIVCKLFNDKITVSRYVPPKVTFKYYSEYKKEHIATGVLSDWNWNDMLRRERSFKASLNRTIRTMKELSDKNIFCYFLTISFNEKYVDRKSAVDVHKKFKNIMKRLKYYYGDTAYLAVAEFHKDMAIHYHLMINFAIAPKLHYVGLSPKGHSMFHFATTAEIKREDCFFTFEKLQANNLSYLLKYILKGVACPLSRRFSASTNLNRSRVQDKIGLEESFDVLKDTAEDLGFISVFDNHYSASYEYVQKQNGACAVLDSSSRDTKDGNLSDIFYSMIDEFFKRVKLKAEKRQKLKSIEKQVEQTVIDKKLPLGQLAFHCQQILKGVLKTIGTR